MKGVPRVVNIEILAHEIAQNSIPRALPPHSTKWLYKRCEGFPGWCLGMRLKVAWKVFTGQLDALKWEA